MSCNTNITAGFLLNCDTPPMGGLESSIVIIPFDDINRTTTTISTTNELLVTNLVLKTGKTGFVFHGVKQSNGKNYSLVAVENLPNRVMHGITGKILTPSVENKLQLQKLMTGGKYVVVVKQNWKGVNSKDAFEILGYNSGLEITEATNESSAESNTILIKLSNVEGYEEPKLPFNLLKTDYDTTNIAFGNLFIQI
jgi:hypothetical protein